MHVVDIISKKKENKELTQEEIDYFINGYTNETIPDYQIAALLMSIRLNDMTDKEMVYLTEAMLKSGKVLNYSNVEKVIVDKHSTGGVGDKTSLVLIPLLASLGYAVSKMSGRGLSHTGGTIDKLESFEGFNVERTENQIIDQVNEIGCVIVGQSKDIVPADKKLYALRDVTSTVDSIPLIASSIMSKKLALGAQIILLDVKYGNGAFMKDKISAKNLAQKMITIGNAMGKKTIACISSMEQPLGSMIGNALEVQEALGTLQGKGNNELRELCIDLASEYLIVDKVLKKEEAISRVKEKLDNGEAYNKFLKLLEYQGVQNFDINISQNKKEIFLDKKGYVEKIEAIDIGMAAMKIGAGRETKEDEIDLTVGVELLKKVGDFVSNEPIATIYYNDKKNLDEAIKLIKDSYYISSEKVSKPNLIEEFII